MNDLERAEQQLGDLAARQWWLWRYHYLEARRTGSQALLADLTDEQVKLFEEFTTSQFTGARMHDPNSDDLEAATLVRLITEADAGWVPFRHGTDNYVQIDPVPHVNPFEAPVMPRDLRGYAEQNRGVVLAVGGVLALFCSLILFRVMTTPPAQAAQTEPTPTLEPTTAAWHADGTTTRDAMQQLGMPGIPPSSAPVSLEIDGAIYPVQATQVAGNIWAPDNAKGEISWLQDSYVNMVFCMHALPDVQGGTTIQVRDTTGTVKHFANVIETPVQRNQIEVLSQRIVGLTLIECGGTGAMRSVLTATYQP